MKKILRIIFIIILVIGFAALAIWGVNAAAAGTHAILGDAGYRPFFTFGGLL